MAFYWPIKLQLIEKDMAPIIIDLTIIGTVLWGNSDQKVNEQP